MIIASVLEGIFNLSLSLQLSPKSWKQAAIPSILKKSNTALPHKCILIYLPNNFSIVFGFVVHDHQFHYFKHKLNSFQNCFLNTLRTGEENLRFYITTVQDGWRKSAFLTRACFPCTIHLIMQYIEPVSEWSCWRILIETWPHSELIFRHRAYSI